MRILLISATAMISLPVVQPALAQSQSKAVHFADLDLTRAKDQKELDHRISDAATSVCDRNDDIRDLTKMNDYWACRKAALASSHDKVALAIARKEAAERSLQNPVTLAAH